MKVYLTPLVMQYLIVITVNLNIISVGMSLGWGSPILVKLTNKDTNPLEEILTQDQCSWVVSVGFISASFLIFMPSIINLLGRKYTVISAFIPSAIGGFLCIFVTSYWAILVAKFFCGIGGNMLSSTVPTYSAEMASKEIRGCLGTIFQISLSLGYTIMVSVGPHMSYEACNIMFIAIVFLTTIPTLFLPETPYALFTKGKKDESLKLLTSLRGSEALAIEEISAYSSDDDKLKAKPKIFSRTFIKAVLLLSTLSVFGIMTGHNCLSIYLQPICISTQINIKPELTTAIVATVGFVSCFSSTFLTDKFGRKPILSYTAVGIAIGMFGLGTYFYLKDNNYEINGFTNFVPLVSMILVIVCYSSGFASLFFLLIPEFFDGPERATGVSIITGFLTGVNFLAVHFFPLMLEKLGEAITFWSFALICIMKCLFVVFLWPETKGKTFLEIQESLGTTNLKI